MRKRFRKISRTENVASVVVRSWDTMNYDILVEVMKRVPWKTRLPSAFKVSKTWLSAVADSMSPPGVIDLRPLDLPELKYHERTFCNLIKRMLDSKPANFWSELYLCTTLLKENKYKYLAKRFRSLKRLFISEGVGLYCVFIRFEFPLWKKLTHAKIPAHLVRYCSARRKVECLELLRIIDDKSATILRDKYPRLKQLRITSCALSVNALSVILDGHKNLKLLDTRHCFRVPNFQKLSRGCITRLGIMERNEAEIRHKASGIKVHLDCDRQKCGHCLEPVRYCVPVSSLDFYKQLPKV